MTGVAAVRPSIHSAAPSAVRDTLVANGTAGVVTNPGRNRPNVLLLVNY